MRQNQGGKWCQSLICYKHRLKGQSETKSHVKPTWSANMTVLRIFLEFSLNFISKDIKKHYKMRKSQGGKWCQNLICQKHSSKGQSKTKSTVKPT